MIIRKRSFWLLCVFSPCLGWESGASIHSQKINAMITLLPLAAEGSGFIQHLDRPVEDVGGLLVYPPNLARSAAIMSMGSL